MSTPDPNRSDTAAEPQAQTICWSCHKPIVPGDRFCRHCGRRQFRGDTWYYRPGWILFLTFCVLGIFTLPLIWKSPFLSRTEKWILAIINIGFFLATIYLLYAVTVYFIHYYSDLNSQLQELNM